LWDLFLQTLIPLTGGRGNELERLEVMTRVEAVIYALEVIGSGKELKLKHASRS
jgi:hypothetical protein